MTPQNQPVEQKPVSRKALELMLLNGEDFVSAVQEKIDKGKLPYKITQTVDGKFILEDTLSAGELHLAKFITVDAQTNEMKDRARKASVTPYEVLINGATGTGKEIIARSMIANRTGAFKAINCAGIPEQLIESILFGHTKGSFTGATSDKPGLIAQAVDGVMFLDEIGELPILMQAKLLRAIQEKTICKIGSGVDEPINCKFVFATNRNLVDMVKQGTFREDLYARIYPLELNIKSLKHRMCDAVPIAKSLKGGDKFLEKYEGDLSSGAIDLPYNVRSIQTLVIRYNVFGSIR